MGRKEKMIEALRLANELSREHGVYASVEFIGYGNHGKGIETCYANMIAPNGKCLTTICAEFKTFDESLDLAIQFFKDAINVMEVRNVKH